MTNSTGMATTTATAAARARFRGVSESPDDSKMWADVASALVHEIVHPWQQAPRPSRQQVLNWEGVVDSLNNGVMEPRSDHPVPDQHQPKLPSSDEWQSPPYTLPCDGDEPPEFTAAHPKVLSRQTHHQSVDHQPSPRAESQATAALTAVDENSERASHRDGSLSSYLAARPLANAEAPQYKPLGLRGGLVSPPDTPNPEDMGAKMWNESWAPSLKHEGGGLQMEGLWGALLAVFRGRARRVVHGMAMPCREDFLALHLLLLVVILLLLRLLLLPATATAAVTVAVAVAVAVVVVAAAAPSVLARGEKQTRVLCV